VRAFIEQHAESRFTPWSGPDLTPDGTTSRTYDRVGFRRDKSETSEYFILPESFRNVVCKGLEPQVAVKALKNQGWLIPDKEGKATRKERLPGVGLTRCYKIVPQDVKEDAKSDKEQ
jgi:putative DNA primase/helicase